MKRNQIVVSEREPRKEDLWLKPDGSLLYFSNNGWSPVVGKGGDGDEKINIGTLENIGIGSKIGLNTHTGKLAILKNNASVSDYMYIGDIYKSDNSKISILCTKIIQGINSNSKMNRFNINPVTKIVPSHNENTLYAITSNNINLPKALSQFISIRYCTLSDYEYCKSISDKIQDRSSRIKLVAEQLRLLYWSEPSRTGTQKLEGVLFKGELLSIDQAIEFEADKDNMYWMGNKYGFLVIELTESIFSINDMIEHTVVEKLDELQEISVGAELEDTQKEINNVITQMKQVIKKLA